MKKIILFFYLILNCILCVAQNDFTKAAKSSKYVVKLYLYNKNIFIGFGSGVIIFKNGYILTCNHLIERGDSTVVIIKNDTLTSTLIGYNKKMDFAIIKIDKKLGT